MSEQSDHNTFSLIHSLTAATFCCDVTPLICSRVGWECICTFHTECVGLTGPKPNTNTHCFTYNQWVKP